MADFIPTGKPGFSTKGVSSYIVNEFALVAIAIASKADSTRFNTSTWTGTQDFTGALVTVALPTTSFAAANKLYADAIGQNASLPNQAGNALKFITSNGTTASWAYPFLKTVNVVNTTQAMTPGNEYLLSNVLATILTAPALPSEGDAFAVTVLNGVYTNTIAFGAQSVIGFSGVTITGNLELDQGGGLFIYSSSLGKWVMH